MAGDIVVPGGAAARGASAAAGLGAPARHLAGLSEKPRRRTPRGRRLTEGHKRHLTTFNFEIKLIHNKIYNNIFIFYIFCAYFSTLTFLRIILK